MYATDPKKLNEENAKLDAEERRIRGGVGLPSGGGTRIKLDANGDLRDANGRLVQ